MPEAETFTDFMIGAMEGEDNVTSAICIYRRDNGTIGYKAFRQEFADSLGILKFTLLSIENDLITKWRSED